MYGLPFDGKILYLLAAILLALMTGPHTSHAQARAPDAPQIVPMSEEQYYVVERNGAVILRAEPNALAKGIKALTEGETVSIGGYAAPLAIDDTDTLWFKVATSDGQNGFIQGREIIKNEFDYKKIMAYKSSVRLLKSVIDNENSVNHPLKRHWGFYGLTGCKPMPQPAAKEAFDAFLTIHNFTVIWTDNEYLYQYGLRSERPPRKFRLSPSRQITVDGRPTQLYRGDAVNADKDLTIFVAFTDRGFTTYNSQQAQQKYFQPKCATFADHSQAFASYVAALPDMVGNADEQLKFLKFRSQQR